MNRAFLYIDILGFEDLVRTKPDKVDQVFKIFDSLKVHKHGALQTIVFSDTILVFNKDESWPTHYYCTYLVEYAQELFYRLSYINIYFRAILTYGEFNYSKLNNIDAYYGLTLIDAHRDEGTLPGFGLYVDKILSEDIIVFDKIDFTEKYEYILLCQSLVNLYKSTSGVLPVDINIFHETDTYYKIDEDLRFFREIEFLKNNHKIERVKEKYQVVYNTYKKALPLFFEIFEQDGFLPFSLNADYTGSINSFDLLSERELENTEGK